LKKSNHKIGFRKANTEDIGFLVFLRKLTMDEHLKDADIFMTDEQHQSRVLECFEDSFLILLDGHVIGVLKLGVISSNLHIRQFQILPEYQGKRIGKSVLDIVKKKAIERQCDVTLYVLLKNPAKGLYLRNGFEVISSDKLQHFMRCSIINHNVKNKSEG